MTPTMSMYRKEAGGVDFPTFLYYFHFMWRLLEALKNKGPQKSATACAATFAATFTARLSAVSVPVKCHFIGSHGRQSYNDRIYRSQERCL